MDRLRHSPSFARGLVALAALCAAALALGQTVVPISGQSTVQPGPNLDTATFFPQINESVQMRRIAGSNPESARDLPIGAPNDLVSGGIGGFTTAVRKAKFPGTTSNGWFPPDPQIAVSESHIVQVVNASIAFYTKTGQLRFRQDFNGRGFFSSVKQFDFIFDPKVFFDPDTEQFYVIALELDEPRQQSALLIAVSDDSNPEGTWYQYRIDAIVERESVKYWFDYPGWGFNKDAVVATGNMFAFTAGQTFVQAMVFRKDQLSAGQPLTVTKFEDNTTFTIQVAKTRDQFADHVYGASLQTTSSVRMYAWSDVLGTPQMRFSDVQVPGFDFIGAAPMVGGARVSTLSGRLLDATFNRGTLLTGHTTAVPQGARRSQVTWYEISPGSWPDAGVPQLVQSGNVALPGNTWAYQPALAMNDVGDISMVFTRSSGQTGPEGVIATRRAGDPLGRMGNPVQIVSSPHPSRDAGRWGDYFSVDVDPIDGRTFWGVHQVTTPSGTWTTEISSWQVGSAGGLNDPLAIRPDSVEVVQGFYVDGDIDDVTEADDFTYDVDSTQVGRFGQFATVELEYESPFAPFDSSRLDIIALGAISNGRSATATLFIYNVKTGRWDFVRSAPTSSRATPFAVNLRTGLDRYIGDDRVVRIRYRLHDPVKRRGVNAIPFRMNLDTIQIFIAPNN